MPHSKQNALLYLPIEIVELITSYIHKPEYLANWLTAFEFQYNFGTLPKILQLLKNEIIPIADIWPELVIRSSLDAKGCQLIGELSVFYKRIIFRGPDSVGSSNAVKACKESVAALHLFNISVSKDYANTLFSCLKLSPITELVLYNIHLTPGAEILSKSFEYTKIKSLVLEVSNNKMGIMLTGIAKMKCLEKLYIRGNDGKMSFEACEFISNNLISKDGIGLLELTTGKLDFNGIIALSSQLISSRLTSLQISNSQFNQHSADIFAARIALSNIRFVRLPCNDIDDHISHIFSKHFHNWKSVVEIDLSGNEIGKYGASFLFDAFSLLNRSDFRMILYGNNLNVNSKIELIEKSKQLKIVLLM
jgi:hypothetical protein